MSELQSTEPLKTQRIFQITSNDRKAVILLSVITELPVTIYLQQIVKSQKVGIKCLYFREKSNFKKDMNDILEERFKNQSFILLKSICFNYIFHYKQSSINFITKYHRNSAFEINWTKAIIRIYLKMKWIIFLVLLALCISAQQNDELYSPPRGESWILDLVDKLGKRFYELKMDTSNPGKSILGYEKELGALWQNFLTCSAWIVGTEIFVHSANFFFVRYGIEQIVSSICSLDLNYTIFN